MITSLWPFASLFVLFIFMNFFFFSFAESILRLLILTQRKIVVFSVKCKFTFFFLLLELIVCMQESNVWTQINCEYRKRTTKQRLEKRHKMYNNCWNKLSYQFRCDAALWRALNRLLFWRKTLFSLDIARYCSLRTAFMVVSHSIVFKTIYCCTVPKPYRTAKAKAMAKYKNII